MTGFFDAFLADVVNDCVEGQTGPMDWSETDRALYENARRTHEGWSGSDTTATTSDSDDPWEVLPCDHLRGELHDCAAGPLAGEESGADSRFNSGPSPAAPGGPGGPEYCCEECEAGHA